MNVDDDITTSLLFCTVRIEGHLSDGATSIGTGFLLATEKGGLEEMVLVTNNHVVAGCEAGKVTVHTQPKERTAAVSPRPFEVDISDFEKRWVPHPDGEVDLCAMPLKPIRQALAQHKVEIFCRALSTRMFPSAEQLSLLSAAEPVLMVGYPDGLWDKKHALPLLRSGLTASHPEVSFNGRPWGAVDIAAFPGSSGSPIVRIGERDSGIMTYRTQQLGPCLLLGVLWGGPLIGSEGRVDVAPAPTLSTMTAFMELPMHLGYYVRADQLADLLDAVKA